jgi:Zn-dependent peptidase ImmA (M78 family)
MERIQSINPERIAWCCAEHGMTPVELAAKLGIAATSMERLMTGQDSLTFNQLRKIAEYFDRGVLFFLEAGPVDEAQVHTTQFRTLANTKPELSYELKALIERVEKQREIYLSLLEDLDDPDRPGFSPPDLSKQSPREAARLAREWLGLSDRNSFETYRAAVEVRGVLVFRSNGYAGKWQIPKTSPILGFTLYTPDWPVIVIRKQPWESQQSFTLMHELGHLLLHKISSIDDEEDLRSHEGQEREANAFAGLLLVPDAFLATIQDADRPNDVSAYDEWLEGPRRRWGVSSEVILRRLLDVGRLPQSQYQAYRQGRAQAPFIPKDGGNRTYRYREPIHVFGDTFVRTVLDAMNARHVTLAKGSSYLDGLKIKDLHRLERLGG